MLIRPLFCKVLSQDNYKCVLTYKFAHTLVFRISYLRTYKINLFVKTNTHWAILPGSFYWSADYVVGADSVLIFTFVTESVHLLAACKRVLVHIKLEYHMSTPQIRNWWISFDKSYSITRVVQCIGNTKPSSCLCKNHVLFSTTMWIHCINFKVA